MSARDLAPSTCRGDGLTPATAWQPIETAPRDGTKIDLWVTASSYCDAERVPDGWWGECDVYNGVSRVSGATGWCRHGDRYGDYCVDPVEDGGGVATHWMPLPDPPAAGLGPEIMPPGDED